MREIVYVVYVRVPGCEFATEELTGVGYDGAFLFIFFRSIVVYFVSIASNLA